MDTFQTQSHEIIDLASIPCREISDPERLVKNPMVSVNMITYNHAPFIAEAIDGVINQETEYPFELIIGDDCSTDQTLEIALDYQKRYPEIIRILTAIKNVGARRNGLRVLSKVRGKYRASCEGDDYWHESSKLQQQVQFMEEHHECGMVHTRARIHDQETGFIKSVGTSGEIHIAHPSPELFESIFTGAYAHSLNIMHIHTCSALIRYNVELDIRQANPVVFSTNRFKMGDTPKWFELSRVTSIGFIDKELATYRLRRDSINQRGNTPKRLAMIFSGYDLRLYYLAKYSVTSVEAKETVRDWCRNVMVACLAAGNKHTCQTALDMLKESDITPTSDMLLLKRLLAIPGVCLIAPHYQSLKRICPFLIYVNKTALGKNGLFHNLLEKRKIADGNSAQ